MSIDPAYTLSRARILRQSATGSYAQALAAYEAAKAALQEAAQLCEDANREYELALSTAMRAGLAQ